MTAARERLDAWKAVRAAVRSEIDGLEEHIGNLRNVKQDNTAATTQRDLLAVSLPMIEEQAKQAAFDVVRLERYEQLRAENPNKRAALVADRARAWVSQHPEAWEALL